MNKWGIAMNNDDSLDLLDLDDADSMDALPEVPAFAAPRPKKPWLLLSLGLVIIVGLVTSQVTSYFTRQRLK